MTGVSFLMNKNTEKGIKVVDNIPKKVYNNKCKEDKQRKSAKHWKGEKAVGKKRKKKKKSIQWKDLTINALIDLIIGIILIIIDKLIG